MKIYRHNNTLIFESNKPTFKETVIEAIQKGVCLDCANFYDADLRDVDFAGQSLYNANFAYAHLEGAKLTHCCLNEANFEHCRFSQTDFTGSTLVGSNFSLAHLISTSLVNCYCKNSVFDGATIENSNLFNSNFTNSNFRSVSFKNTVANYTQFLYCDFLNGSFYKIDFIGADFTDAIINKCEFNKYNLKSVIINYVSMFGCSVSFTNLENVKFVDTSIKYVSFKNNQNMPYASMSCPSDGSFIGWKKVDNRYLIKLQIPEDAKRSSATYFKCRCDKALVLEITDLKNNDKSIKNITNTKAYNCYGSKVNYIVGEMVYPDSFDDNRWNECSNGIHFFINKQDAINYF